MNKGNRMNTTKHPVAFLAVLAAAALSMTACSGGEHETEVPTSGDPEADRRADVRVDAEGPAKKDGAPKTLYDRIGGEQMITAIVDDMTTRVLADPRVNFERKDVKTGWLGGTYEPWVPTHTNVTHFKARMVEFLTLAAGGPVEYRGRDLRES